MHDSIDNYDSDDLIEIPLDEYDACYSYGHDANIYEDEFAIVPYVKHEIVAIAPILDSSFDEKHDCNDVIINSINVNCANNMQNPKLGDANFAMSTTCCNDHDWGDSSYDLENLFKPHDEYEIDNSVCNNIESGFGRVSTLDPTYLENVQSYEIFDKSGFGEVMTLVNVNPTILEECQLCIQVDHEKNALCDGYIVEFIHDATENYYEGGIYACRNCNNIKFPLYVLKILKLCLFCLPMLVDYCSHKLFAHKIPMHRKWVRLKCASHILHDALFMFQFLSFM